MRTVHDWVLLQVRFSDHFAIVKDVMVKVASSFVNAEELSQNGYQMYCKFRPEVPKGKAGWGKSGTLHVHNILSLMQ